MHEIAIDSAEILAVFEHVHELLAHAYQRRRSARGEIDAAE